MSSTDIHERLLESWNRRDFESYGKLLHSRYSYTGPDGKTIEGGPKVGVDVAKQYAAAFPDGVVSITNSFSSGSKLVCEFVCRGTHGGDLMGIAPTHKPVEIHVCNVVDLEDGKVVREREYMDMLSILEQIGAAPELVTQPPSHEEVQHAPQH